jgi:hypothetical protein
MPELNKANRQVCDVDIRILKTLAPFLFFDSANTTTVGLTGDSVYAMKKGTRAIAFQNPIEGTLTVEAQVYPFKFFTLLSDGVVETTGIKAVKTTVKATEAGKLTISAGDKAEIQTGTVFVYESGAFGDTEIAGEYAEGVFTAEKADDIVADTEYEVGYIVNKTSGVKRVSFNNKKIPKDYFITMSTVDKDEEGILTPFIITAYKASIQRDFELSFSSEGDPASVSITFDLMEDKNGNVLDMLEDTDEAE